MKKVERQMMIKQIILNNDIATQEELLTQLQNKGVKATQATISRDIKELNLIKTNSSDGGVKYTIYQNHHMSPEDKLNSTIRSVVTAYNCVQFMNIIVTLPGNAHVIGALIDDIEFPEIVGTVAGNDTIILISNTNEEAQKVYTYFESVMADTN
ncbi:Arginine pathway regulatory protein ArgR, repressor of arg regulon [Alkalibacterium sp. AK22]|uniref:arginine repressor n=1 Tax=Alkalibacterium sp. AK22 TaxID=1229520 RepID=UPI00044A8826|nr:arginine repressor [Alkalibacterium sp. AK22]EXJ22439.1 Arginine pathway regulatory protein ArgR, repressor of arg regulon [Alkalibacterium sp. AK22]